MSQRCAMDDERGGLIDELTTGFEALMRKAEELTKANALLLDSVKRLQEDQHHLTPDKSMSASSALPDLASLHSEVKDDWRQDGRIDKGIQAWKLLKIATVPAVPLRSTASRQARECEDMRSERNGEEKAPGLAPIRTPNMEKDFTTNGQQGDLRCPFSRATTAKAPATGTHEAMPADHPKMPAPMDPIAAESPEASLQTDAQSATGSASKCPIRYLDQQSPEEVAKYFESHKHEIPRSHEVCVRRYQANEDSIRALDAKYGSLERMLQSLGEMHKPMLPAKAEEDEAADKAAGEADAGSMEKVEKWAQNCANDATPPPPADADDATGADASSDTRTSRFERPLREVRLGESPSRPWGIQVPYSERAVMSSQVAGKKTTVASSIAAPADEPPAPANGANPPEGRCPFRAAAAAAEPHPRTNSRRSEERRVSEVVEEPQSEAEVFERVLERRAASRVQPQIVFNGPVFFGYPAESAAALMKSLRGD